MTLNDYLKQQKIRAKRFAEEAGIPVSSVTRYLRGERGLSLESAIKASRATSGCVAIEQFRLRGEGKFLHDDQQSRGSQTELPKYLP